MGTILNKKIIWLLFITLFFDRADGFFFNYMNDETVSFRTILTGDCATSIDYNIVNDKQGTIGGQIRLFGIHNMNLEIPGYETIHLIKNDVCLHPNLFTMLNVLFKDYNMLVQRWACVKWFMPLSFGFKVSHDVLTVSSSIYKYRALSWFRATKTIKLIKKIDVIDQVDDQNLTIKVSVNGRTAIVNQKTVLQIYSQSALIAACFVNYIFWPLL